MAPKPQNQRVLARAIDDIITSYAEHGNINHLDDENLPSRREIEQLLDDLISILFPGYFTEDAVDSLTCRYFVGERCARALRSLERAMVQTLQLPVRRGSTGGRLTVSDRADAALVAHERATDLIRQIPLIREILDTDVNAALAGDPAARNPSEVIMAYPGVEAIAVYRIAHYLHGLGVPLIPRMMSELVHRRTGIDIHPGATIGGSFFIDHGTGVVIGETTEIGEHVKLYQGVTLGALSVTVSEDDNRQTPPRRRHPRIEDEVTIYSGATILGGDTVIGRGSTIGGNVWLTHGVPPGTTVSLDKPSLRFVPAPAASDGS